MQNETVVQTSLGQLRPSPYNRRRQKDDLTELAASLKQHGMIHPIVGRQVNGYIEIVCGERRYKAAKAAGLKTVPIIVRELSDEQARERCLEENLKRADIHPMDEAEAFEELRDDYAYTIEQIAEKFARSASHVYKRLKLTSLCKEARTAYLAGELDDRVAFEVARVANHKAQLDLLKNAKAVFGENDRAFNDFRHAAKDYMLELSLAPFPLADNKLTKAGTCATCPKRSGKQRELFGDLAKKHDRCLDSGCYGQKVDAWWTLETAAAVKRGDRVLSAKDAKKELGHGGVRYNSKYCAASDELGIFSGNYKSKKQLRSALKKDPPRVVLARTETGKVFELYERAEVIKKLKAAGLITKGTATRAAAGSSSYAARDKREHTKRKLQAEIASRAIAAAAKKARASKSPKFFEPLALLMCCGHNATETAKARGFKKREELEKAIRKMSGAELRGVVVELALRDSMYFAGQTGSSFGKAMKSWRINMAAIGKTVRAEHAAKEKAKKAKDKKKPAKKPKKKATKKTKTGSKR